MALVAIASDGSLQSEASDDNLTGSSTGDVTMAQPLLAQVSYALKPTHLLVLTQACHY